MPILIGQNNLNLQGSTNKRRNIMKEVCRTYFPKNEVSVLSSCLKLFQKNISMKISKIFPSENRTNTELLPNSLIL